MHGRVTEQRAVRGGVGRVRATMCVSLGVHVVCLQLRVAPVGRRGAGSQGCECAYAGVTVVQGSEDWYRVPVLDRQQQEVG